MKGICTAGGERDEEMEEGEFFLKGVQPTEQEDER